MKIWSVFSCSSMYRQITIVIIVLFVYLTAIAQNAGTGSSIVFNPPLPNSCKLSDLKDYLLKNKLSLNPIEGLYDVNWKDRCIYKSYEPRVFEDSETIGIIKHGRYFYFYGPSGDGYSAHEWLLIEQIGETPLYNFMMLHKKSNQNYSKILSKQRVLLNDGMIWDYSHSYTEEEIIVFKSNPEILAGEDRQLSAIKIFPTSTSLVEEHKYWTGTGFALKDGYLVTNYHVVEGANSIQVVGVKGNFNTSYKAVIIGTDKINDLALLRISDSSFSGFGPIPYSIASNPTEVGEDIFVLGYPLTSTMGDEIKLTTGIISSKTGFQGDVSLYQISAPIQPGNSGGPLFNKKGNVIGIVSAKHADAENVGYAIKTSYLRNLIESCVSASIIPANNSISTLPLTGKVKSEKNFVFSIECSSSSSPNNYLAQNHKDSSEKVYNYPPITSKGDNKLTLISVSISSESTVLELSTNNSFPGGYHQWFRISPDAYILANGIKYKLSGADGIALAPNVTYYSSSNDTKTFRLTFPPISLKSTTIDFVESPDSEWKLMGIKLQK